MDVPIETDDVDEDREGASRKWKLHWSFTLASPLYIHRFNRQAGAGDAFIAEVTEVTNNCETKGDSNYPHNCYHVYCW